MKTQDTLQRTTQAAKQKTQKVQSGQQAAPGKIKRPPRETGAPVLGRLKAERVQEMLSALPGLHTVDGATAVHRLSALPTRAAAKACAVFALELGAAAKLPVQVVLAGHEVVVTLGAAPPAA